MTIETKELTNRVEVLARMEAAYHEILSSEAMAFVAKLHNRFNPRRRELLKKRAERLARIEAGEMPDFLPETAAIRAADWKAAPCPTDIQDRRVEITGPVDRKMIINALNAQVKVFMADFEDATSPTFANVIEGQINLRDAIRRQIDFVSPEGKAYRLNERTATLFVRPRGWHLDEKHVVVDGEPVSASIFDFGLYFFHNAHALVQRGTAPYFYLPKMESHLEARLWNDIFVFAQQELGIAQGTIKATVLIETILAAFEMDEIIYELREHSAGLNAGRWDYLFSAIKKFALHADKIFPDRAQLTMTVPFMRAYVKLLVRTCHRRGVHAMGGMAAFIPSRKDEEVNRNAFAKVQADKKLEAETGFDGTWIAHPDLAPVALAEFDATLGNQANQLHETKSQSYEVSAADLTNFAVEGGSITEAGLRTNINIGILYIESWLMGVGAAALYNLMEDAATAEISRAQVWQWLRHEAKLADGRTITPELYAQLLQEEANKAAELLGKDRVENGKFALAVEIFDQLVRAPQFPDFLTLIAYKYF